MAQKYGSLANTAAGGAVVCVVCEKPGPWSWTDLHAEAYCVNCGTPHMVDGEQRGACQLKDTWVPVVREYHQETGKRVGLGCMVIERDYITELEERRAFFVWVDDRYPEGVPDPTPTPGSEE